MEQRTKGNSRKGLYKRGGRWWCYSDPVDGVRRTTGAKTLDGAQEWLRERERRAANPAYSASHTETLGKWVKRMLADKQQQKSEATSRFYAEKCGHLMRVFGENCPLVLINADAVDRYKNQRFEEGASHHTIAKEFIALRQTLKKAARAECYSYDLGKLFPPEFGTGYKARETVLTPELEAKLKELLPPHQWAAVAFILATSARLGEMQRAQPGDWDKERGTVRLRGTKTEGSDRVIPVVSVMVPYLEAAAPFMPFDFGTLTHKLAKVCKRLGVTTINANDLRRTCATRFMESGADPYHVTRITGHSDLKMLKRVYDRSRVGAIGEALEGQLTAHAEQRAKRASGTETAQQEPANQVSPDENDEKPGTSNPQVGGSNPSGRAQNGSNAAEKAKPAPEVFRVYTNEPRVAGTELAQFPAASWALAEAANRLLRKVAA